MRKEYQSQTQYAFNEGKVTNIQLYIDQKQYYLTLKKSIKFKVVCALTFITSQKQEMHIIPV